LAAAIEECDCRIAKLPDRASAGDAPLRGKDHRSKAHEYPTPTPSMSGSRRTRRFYQYRFEARSPSAQASLPT
jgi:hypothetical protein